MSINLAKGGTISLEKSLNRVRIGLAWDETGSTGEKADADLSAVVLKGDDAALKKFVTNEHFVFYNNRAAPDDSVKHSGDNRTGAGEGDDESIIVNLTALPAETIDVTFIATIHNGAANRQDWSKLHAVATLYNDEIGAVLARYDLNTNFGGKVCTQPVSLHKNEAGLWTFKAIGAGYDFGLIPFVEKWQN